jgi:hypothetical protein
VELESRLSKTARARRAPCLVVRERGVHVYLMGRAYIRSITMAVASGENYRSVAIDFVGLSDITCTDGGSIIYVKWGSSRGKIVKMTINVDQPQQCWPC